ncbi:MAG TPA: flagellar hook capping FlgD N-terminal domain-containing protein [Planctomycetaceae bacterium]|nr:flagellar hook capping FlgD N-terminal domain-containing protein [Planctomycetaceae bacterium]
MSILGVPTGTSATSSAASGNSTSNNGNTTGQSGFAALTSQDFLTMLITELKNQDPTQPVSNSELLQQLSQMQALTSNVELNTTLKTFAANQQVSSGASFLGKVVTGTDANNQPVSGIADNVFLQNGTLMIGIGSSSISIANVTGVSLGSQQTGS